MKFQKIRKLTHAEVPLPPEVHETGREQNRTYREIEKAYRDKNLWRNVGSQGASKEEKKFRRGAKN